MMLISPLMVWADEWQDPETKVNYAYDPKGTTAEVKTDSPPIAGGDIAILSKITINGKEYSVTAIGKQAFIYNNNITSVNLPSSITTIHDDAFHRCQNLVSVNIPNSVTSIGLCAFVCCKLVEINIPESVSHIDVDVFGECVSLEKIKVDAKNNYYDSRNDCNAIIETSSNTLISGCRNTVIPSSVTSIGVHAFSGCSGLYNIDIPSGVTSIEGNAFFDCVNLTSVSIPSSVTNIAAFAFSNCSSLTSVTMKSPIPVSIAESTFDNRANAILYVPYGCMAAYEAADYWKDFKEIVETPDIAFVDDNVKALCVSNWDTNGDGELSKAEAAAVTSLGEVFKENANITSFNELQYFTGLTEIGTFSLLGCSGLTSINIPEGVATIGDMAFTGCSSLTSITIPSSVTTIGSGVFDGCSSLPIEDNLRYADSYLVGAVDKTLSSYNIKTGTIFIGSEAFGRCSSLTSINIPEGVTSIEGGAFRCCSSLTSISIPSSVTSIGNGAFQLCSSMTSITIPKGVTSIGNSAFESCPALTSITFPPSVTSIGSNAFDGCYSLTSITIPEGIMSIGNFAFAGCDGLTSIKVENGNPKYDSRENCNAIIEISSNTLIAGCQNTIIPSIVTSIGEGTFCKCSGLTSITIPSSVTSIGVNAFRDCSNLVSITIPSNVTNIGDYAFYGCSALNSMKVEIQSPLPIDKSTFGLVNTTLYVPYGCKDAYEKATYWKDFKEIVEMPKVTSSLAISDASGLVGCTFNLPVSMKNEDEITAMQFELCLPEGVSVASATLTDRKDGHSIDYSQLANGNYQFTVFSSSSKAINGSEGDVANISLSISGSMAAGNYTIQMKNIELITTAGDAIHQSDLSATLTVLNVKPGDVNGDDKLSITDAVGIVNYILGKTSANFHPEAADLNGDGSVSITDAVKVVNIILNQGSGVKEQRKQEMETEREPQ